MSAVVDPFEGRTRPEDYPTRVVIKRLPQDKDELYWTVWGLWGYRIPSVKICHDHIAPFDAFAEAFFADVPMAMWLASRGLGGKSRTLALLGLTEAVLYGCEVSILGGSSAQSQNVHDATKDAWSWHASPRYLLSRPPTMYTTILNNGGLLRTLTASQTSVRGPHPPRLRMDEADEMDQAILDAALGQPMEQMNQRGEVTAMQTTISSTHQNPNGTVTEMIQRSKKQGFPVHRWCVVAGTMVTTATGNKPVESVEAGDWVVGWSSEGLDWGQVTWSGCTKVADTIAIVTESGAEVRCTGDHQILTTEGWREGRDLTDNDLLVRDVSGLWQDTGCDGREYEPPENRTVLGVCSSRSSLDPALWVRGAEGEAVEDLCRLLPEGHGAKEHDRQGHAGTQTGWRQTSQNRLEVGSPSSRTAGRLPGGLPDRGPDRDIHRGFSLRDDGSRGPGVAAHTSVRERALCAEGSVAAGGRVRGDRTLVSQSAPLVATTDRVVSVRLGRVEAVYDLTVSGTESFTANGIVVHNCFRESSNPTDGWLTQKAILRAKSVVSEIMWVTEYCAAEGEPVQTYRGAVPIETVEQGDLVWTRKGWQEVTNVFCTGTKPVYAVVTEGGRRYRATGNHRVAVPGGWQRTDALVSGDSLVISDPPHVFSLAGAAMPVTVAVNSGLGGPIVTVGADVPSVPDVAVADIVGSGKRLQMVGARTASVMTHVVDRHVLGNGSEPGRVRDPVGEVDTSHAGDPISVLGSGASPLPAAALTEHRPVDDVLPKVAYPWQGSTFVGADKATGDSLACDFGPAVHTGIDHVASVLSSGTARTWDITVLDTHEFTVQGIVLHNCLQEPSFGGRAIDTDAVDRCFDPAYGTFSGDMMVSTPKQEGRHYITAVDWAKSQDQTIVATFDISETPWVCVAWQKVNKLPWPMLVRRAVLQWQTYGDRFVHDATGVGATAHDLIREYVTSGEFSKVKPVIMGGGRERDAFYTEYIAAIEHDDIKYPRITYAHGEHRYTTPEDLFTGAGHAPDSVVAGALAWSVRRKRVGLVAPGGGTRPSSPWNV